MKINFVLNAYIQLKFQYIGTILPAVLPYHMMGNIQFEEQIMSLAILLLRLHSPLLLCHM